jgi:hypothetical protein
LWHSLFQKFGTFFVVIHIFVVRGGYIFHCNTEYDTNLPVKCIGLGRQVSFTKGKCSRSGEGSWARIPMAHLISPRMHPFVTHAATHLDWAHVPPPPRLSSHWFPHRPLFLNFFVSAPLFSPTMLPAYTKPPSTLVAASTSFPHSLSLPFLPLWLSPPLGIHLLPSCHGSLCRRACPVPCYSHAAGHIAARTKWLCYKRCPSMLPYAAAVAIVSARICRRRRRSILPAAPARSTVDARRCFHQRQPMLPSTVVIAFVGGGCCCRRLSSWWNNICHGMG